MSLAKTSVEVPYLCGSALAQAFKGKRVNGGDPPAKARQEIPVKEWLYLITGFVMGFLCCWN